MEKCRYREAKPRFDVVKAKAAFDRGQTVCRYFDERDILGGEASVLYWADSALGLEYSGSCFEQPAAPEGWAGRTDFSTVVAAKKNNSGKARVYVECPDCRKPIGILIYKGRWACGDCLKLGYRSQFVPPDVFASEKLAALQKKIGPGRPPGMRQANFRRAQNDLEVLKKSVGTFPSVASVVHQRVIRATWLTPEEAGHLAHPDHEIVDDQIAQRLDGQSPAIEPPTAPPEPKPIRFDPNALEITKDSEWLGR